MRLLVIGDTHGNTGFLCDYLYSVAARLRADAIVQLGDFGYWEHDSSGVQFLDDVAKAAYDYAIPLYWLHGNHDKHSLALAKYGDNRTPDGFIVCRPRVYYIPQGHAWEWDGVKMRVFGGAYSVDKPERLELEYKRQERLLRKEGYRAVTGRRLPVVDTAETLWFPEEQMTDAEFEELMRIDSSSKDIIFSHDKPRSAWVGPNIRLADIDECIPNQVRLQRAMNTHQPKFWFHGHLHFRYQTMVRCGNDDAGTTVYGLGPDDHAAPRFWRPTDSWCLVDLKDGEVEVTPAYMTGD